MESVADLTVRLRSLKERLDQIIMGQEKTKEQVLVSLLAGGHALLEGVPGTGKTLLVLALAKLMGCRFRRIQFTPDLMPVDLLGTNVFSPKTQDFVFHAGPVFTDLLLADEINRTPPKTQSALLEAMQEHNATIDGNRYAISPIFTVFATQNPVEFEGTYPLPEAQRDRFLLKIVVEFPTTDDELKMLNSYAAGFRLHDEVLENLQPVMTLEELLLARKIVTRGIRVESAMLNYILKIVTATRSHDAVHFGAGPRATLALLECSKAIALLRGREFITPDDVKVMASPVLLHRVTLTPEAEMEGTLLDDVLKQIFEKTEVPR